ncbi:MAG: hypothetical protein M3083_19780 [Actinomycetota bacterium]|nr:hypothetical protein [Actinomycetota bacterium]
MTATTLTETATPSSGNAPLAVTFTYKETNTGINAISLVSVTGSICGAATYASGDGNSNGMLDPGETWVFTCTHTFIVPGSFTDNATATGIFTATKEPAPKEIASATVGVKPERGTLKICKVAGPVFPSTPCSRSTPTVRPSAFLPGRAQAATARSSLLTLSVPRWV